MLLLPLLRLLNAMWQLDSALAVAQHSGTAFAKINGKLRKLYANARTMPLRKHACVCASVLQVASGKMLN